MPAPMDSLDTLLGKDLADLDQHGLRRHLKVIDSTDGMRITSGGRKLINFSSNDYLGLASHPLLAEAMAVAATWGAGATASRLICGTTAEHAALEDELAAAKRTGAALVFSTGMAAATGTIPALVGKGDVIVLDKLAHACLIDGARASGATLRVFPHNDMEKLESHLKWARRKLPNARVMILTESVFSMDGDLALLREVVELKEHYGAILFLDEAHAVGVCGAGMRGLAGEMDLGARVDVQMGTLGKALGVSGGYIAGSRVLIDFLINRARSFVFSTAPSPAVAAACRASLRIVQSEEGTALRARLHENLRLISSEIKIPQPKSAIIPLVLGSEERALTEAARLQESGFFIPAIRYPTVPRNTARLRITISASHSPEQIKALTECLSS